MKIMHNVSAACCEMIPVMPLVAQVTLNMAYYSYFQFITTLPLPPWAFEVCFRVKLKNIIQ
jgi:hypothetical protein